MGDLTRWIGPHPAVGGRYITGSILGAVATQAYRKIRHAFGQSRMVGVLGKRKRVTAGVASAVATALGAYKRRGAVRRAPMRRRPAYRKKSTYRKGSAKYRRITKKSSYWPRLRHGINKAPVNVVTRKFRCESLWVPQDATIDNGHGWQLECDGHNPDLPFQREHGQVAGEGKKPLGMTDWANGYKKMRVLSCLVEIFVEMQNPGLRNGGVICSRRQAGVAPAGGTDVTTFAAQLVQYAATKSSSVVDGFLQSVRENGEWKTMQVKQSDTYTTVKPIYYMSQYMSPYPVIGSDYDPHDATVTPTSTVLTADNPPASGLMHCEFKFISNNLANPEGGNGSTNHRIRIRKTYTIRYTDPKVAVSG